MKKILLLALFISGFVQAENVNIPDANLKYWLLNSYDLNFDGEIQLSEAQAVTNLIIDAGAVTNFTGIESFSNATSLTFPSYNAPLTNLPVLPNILTCDVYGNGTSNFTSFDASGLINVQTIKAQGIPLTSLNISGLIHLQTLDVSFSGLSYINFTGLSALQTLEFHHCNNLTTLNLSGLGLTNLQTLNCQLSSLTNLNLSGLTNLTNVLCIQNNLTSLNASGCVNLSTLQCQDNPFLASIILSGTTNLAQLNCSTTALSTIDLSDTPHLTFLDCSFSELTTLDVSHCPIIAQLTCNNNPLLTSLFLKCGNPIWQNLNFGSCNSLIYVCADLEDIYLIESKVNQYGYSNCEVNTYCSFVPGGNYNTITGTLTYDADANGCDAGDLTHPNIRVNITDGTNQGATFTNATGNYNFYTQSGSFNVTPSVENAAWFTFTPGSATIPFATNANNAATQNFCMSAIGTHNDLEVIIMPVSPARVGLDALYKVIYKNKGNQPVSGNVSLNFDDYRTDFVSSNPNPTTIAVNSLTWNFSDLMPFESRSVNFTLHVNSSSDIPAVNIGDVLNFSIIINSVALDEVTFDNVFNYDQIVVGSYDPNNIECLEGDTVDTDYIGQYLHYVVNFENTGNYPAENIVVRIAIDPTKYDINTLQLLTTSHEVNAVITGNVIEFIFQQVQLDSGGHGNILFKLKTKSSLVNGDVVSKRADIFFDYNAPVDTGMASTLFQTLNTGDPVDVSLSVYPNPSNGLVNISGQYEIKSVQLYDIQGRLLQTQVTNATQSTLDISNQSSGVYFVKITTEAGNKVERIIRE